MGMQSFEYFGLRLLVVNEEIDEDIAYGLKDRMASFQQHKDAKVVIVRKRGATEGDEYQGAKLSLTLDV